MEPPIPGRTEHYIVHLDPLRSRPVSPYSPEGEIMMFGDLASGLKRRKLSRPMALGLLIVLLLPLIVSIIAMFRTW